MSLTAAAQQPGGKSPAVAASLSVGPDISGLCIGSIVYVPIYISGDNVLSMNLYLEFNHSVLAKAPGSGYANLYPDFNALYNYSYSGTYPTVSYLDISANGMTGTNFTGEKLIDLAFVYLGGSTTIHFRRAPDPTPPPVCKIFDEFGTSLTPITFTDNLVSGYPNLAVGTIGNSQTICSGATPLLLSSTPPTNGTAPTYQWQSSSDNVSFLDIPGATTIDYQPGALTATTYYRQLQNATSTCTGPLPTNTVTITVNPLLPVSISITASANPACEGASVTFTALPVNGGVTPAYQWKVNGNPVGANSNSYTYAPVNADIVTCELTSSEACKTGSPATSNSIVMSVEPIVPASVSIVANVNPVCAGTPVTLIATPVNGGSTPAYQWLVNGAPAGVNSSNYSYIPANNDVVTCVMTSNAPCISGNPATSNSITITLTTPLPVSVSIAASENPTCAGTAVFFTATPVNGGTNPVYQWQIDGGNVPGATSSTFINIPGNGDAISCVVTSNEACVSGNPATSNVITMTVNPVFAVSVSVVASATSVCEGTSVTYTATPVNGGTTPAFQWLVNGVNAGANSATYSYIPVNGDVVTCVLTSSETCTTGSPATSNAVTMTVNPILPVSVSIAASANPVCDGSSVTFTASPLNGGSTPVLLWMVNGTPAGTNSNTYTYVPVNGDVVTCQLTSSASCATGNPAMSNALTMSVLPVLPVAVSITASANPVCDGISVTFFAVSFNTGTTPVYQWMVNGVSVGTNSNTYSYQPANNDLVTCQLTSSEPCTSGNPAMSNTVTMTVHPVLPVSVSVSASLNPVCNGTPVTFTAVPINGGVTPVLQWMVNGALVGTNDVSYTYTPANNDVVTCQLTSSEPCGTGNPATSNAVTMTVFENLLVGSISASQTICSGIVPAELTGTAPLNGTGPTYQWQSSLDNSTFNNINGATMLNYQPAALTTTTYYRQLQNATGPCGGPLPTNVLTLTVNPVLPVAVSITPSANPVCDGISVTFFAVSINAGITPVYQWMVNGVSVGSNSATYSYTPANNDLVTCQLTSSETCTSGNPATSNAVTMTVLPILPVSVTVSPSANPVCNGTAVTFTATGINGGATPSFQWVLNGVPAGSNSATYTYVPADNDMISCVMTSAELCTSGSPATSNIITMSVVPDLQVGSISASQTICSGVVPAQLTATGPLNGTSPAYQWQSSLDNTTFSNIAGATMLNYQPAALTATTYYKQMQDAAGTCGGPLPTNTLTITVIPTFMAGSIGTSQSICSGVAPALLTGTAPTGGSGTYTYQWQESSDNTLFADISGATDLNYQPGVLNATMYYRQVQTGDCGGPATTNVVTITVTQALVVGSISADQTICSGMVPAQLDGIAPLNGTNPTYQWQSSLDNSTFGNINGATSLNYQPGALTTTTYYRTMQNASGTCGGPLPTNTVTITVNPVLPVSVFILPSANPVCDGSAVTFTASPVNGGTSPSYVWKVNGAVAGASSSVYTYTPANNDIITCELTSSETCTSGNPATSNPITMSVMPILPVAVSITSSANPVCVGGSVTFTAVPVNGGTIPAYQWYVNGTMAGTNSSTYTFIPADNDVVTCVLTSSELCVSGNPATSNAVTMTVLPDLAVGSISADQTICSGTTPAQLTAVAPTNGTSPTYQWQSSLNNTTFGNISGATMLNYQPGALTTTTYYRQLQNAAGTCGGPLPTNTVTITVNPSLVAGSISADQAICSGDIPALLTGIAPTGGDGNYTYQWQNSADGVTFADISGAIALNYQPLAQTVTTYYRQVQTGTCGGPFTTNVVTVTVDPPLAVGSIAADQTICTGTAPALLTGTAPSTGTSPTYQWQSSLDNTTFANINGATALNYQPGSLTSTTYYRQIQNASSSCGGPLPTNVVTVVVEPIIIVGSISASQTICTGLIPAQLTGVAPANGTAPVYQWQNSPDNVTFNDIVGANNLDYQPGALTSTTYYRLLQDATGVCGGPAATNVVTITVHPDLAVGSISADQTICLNTAPDLLTGVPPSNGTSPTYQWQSSLDNSTFANINGATTLNYQPGILTATTYFRQIQDATGTCGGPLPTNVVTITTSVFAVIVPGTIGSNQTICVNTAPAALTGTPPANGTSPTYQWQSSLDNVTFANINGATALTYQPGVLTTTTFYHMLQNASATCGGPLPTNVVRINVNPDLVAGSIAANQSICSGQTPALLTATPPANGTSPTYQWQSSLDNTTFGNILGATSQNYQPGAITTTTYFRQVQNAAGTCGGPLLTNVVTITFNPNLIVGSIGANQSICSGTAPAILNGVAPANGTSPTYLWQSSPDNTTWSNVTGATSLNYQPGILGATTYFRQLQNASGTCGGPLATNVVTIIVNPPLTVGSISASQVLCYGSTPAQLIGVAPTGSIGPYAYQWQSSPDNVTFANISGATSLNYQPGVATATTYYRQVQSSACGTPENTNTVTITVNPLPVPTIAGPAAVCANSTGNVYTTEAGMTGYTWTVSAGGTITAGAGTNSVTVTWTGVGAQALTVNYINGNGCTAVTPATYNVTVNALPVPTIAGPASVCVNSAGNVYTTETGMTGYTWTVSAGGAITAGAGTNAITVTWNATGAQVVTVNYTNGNNCTAAAPATYNVTVNPLPVPTIAGPASVCLNSTGNVYTTETGMTAYNWTVSAGGTVTAGAGTNAITVTWNATGAQTVSVNYNNGNGCTAATPTIYNVTVNTLPVPTIAGSASVCVNSTGNVYTTQTGMTGYTWTVSAGGTITAGAGTNALTVTWNTVGAQTVAVNYINGNGCTAATPTIYNVTVNALPVPTIAGPASVCVNSTGNVYTTQTGMTGYTWTVSAGGTITAGTGTNAITVSWTTTGAKTVTVNYINGNGCTAATPATYNVTVNALPIPVITGPASVCVNSTGNVYTTQTGMTGYIWTVTGGIITAGQGTSAATITWNAAGAQSVCVNYINASGCTAAAPVCFPVTVNTIPTPTITGPAAVCQGTTATYTTQTGMTNYVWTVSAGGTIVGGGTSTSNTVTVLWNSTGNQNVTVNYTSTCPGATPGSFAVTVSGAPVPTIGSTNNPCVGSTNNIYYTESGMTGYIWTVSAGGTIVSGQGTSTIDVTWNQIGIQTVSVNYANAAGCFAAQPTVYTVFVNSPPSAAGAITGTASLCAGTSGVVYSTTPITGATSYSWTVPAGATIVSGLGTTSITVNFGPSAVSGAITVAGTNQCGNGPLSSFNVTVNPLPAAAGTITGPASVCAGSSGNVYTVPAISGATSYVWTVPAGATITSGANTNTIVVTFGSTPSTGIITVKGTNTCGSGTVSANFNVTVNAVPAAPVVTANGSLLTSSVATGNQWYYEGTGLIAGATAQTYTATVTGWYWSVVTANGCSSDTSNHVYVLFVGQPELTGGNYNVYPVPNDGKFKISIVTPVEETYTIQVFNLLGEKFYELKDARTSGGRFDVQVDLRPIARGIYTVVFLNGEHQIVKKMVVNK